MEPRVSRRIARLKPSAIRELLKVTERPDILSFAGGLPAPEAFPIAEMGNAVEWVLAHEGAAALQYGTTEGVPALRAWIAERMKSRGVHCRPEQVLITSGSQQGIDLVGKAYLDPGDTVVCESPSYLAAIQAFESYEAQFSVVGTDEHGMRVDELERVLKASNPRLIYLVPTFQNPRGTTLSLERRKIIARLALEHGVTVLEDDPYCELRYRGEPLPSIASLEPRAPVIYLSSFSKTLAPGLRLGWAVAHDEVIRPLVVAKQATDLHTSTLAQRAAARLLVSFDYEGHLARIRALYGERCDTMLAAVARELPAGSTWTVPEGGLFLWVKLPDGYDAEEVLQESLREKVAFVPGAPFFPANPDPTTLRLNFSNRSSASIVEGMKRLGGVLARHRAAVPTPAVVRTARASGAEW